MGVDKLSTGYGFDTEKYLVDEVCAVLWSKGLDYELEFPTRTGSYGVGAKFPIVDIHIERYDMAIECKADAESGSVLKGLGQCIAYRDGGYNPVFISPASSGLEEDDYKISLFTSQDIPVLVYREKQKELDLLNQTGNMDVLAII